MSAGFRTRLRAVLIALARAAAVALVAFHVWLLAVRLGDATLLEPGVALRWGAALALAGLAYLFRRHGRPLCSGRSGVVFWLLALLLHLGGAPLPLEPPPLVEDLLIVLPLGVAAPLVLALAAVRLAGRSPLATARAHARRAAWTPPRRPAAGFGGPGALRVPRPPPAAFA